MKDRKKQYLDAEMTLNEEQELQKTIMCSEDTDIALKKYFSHIDTERKVGMVRIEKNEFFTQVQKRKRFLLYKMAASIIGIIIISGIFIFQLKTSNQKTTEIEMKEAIEITQLALNSFSEHYTEGLKKTQKGMDFTVPMKSLSNLKTDKE